MKTLKKTKAPAEKNSNSETKDAICTHGGSKGNMLITVLGIECWIKSPLFCKKCAEKYLNKYATICNTCKKPIFPGQTVAGTGEKRPKHPYTHTHFDCCPSSGLLCGTWGEGKLIPSD